MTHSIPGYGIFSWKAIGQFRRALAEAGGSAGFAIFQGQDLGWALSPVEIDPVRRHVGDRVEARFAPGSPVWGFVLPVHAPPLRVGSGERQQIGRAACRERVGTAVEISEGAVSLKKKQRNS